MSLNQQDVERIARATLKELGVAGTPFSVVEDSQTGSWTIALDGATASGLVRIKCGQGTTAQWVRQQIFEQFTR